MAKKKKKADKHANAVAKAEKSLRKAQKEVTRAAERLAALIGNDGKPGKAGPAKDKPRARRAAESAAASGASVASGVSVRTVAQLRERAKAKGIRGYSRLTKPALVAALAK